MKLVADAKEIKRLKNIINNMHPNAISFKTMQKHIKEKDFKEVS